jgi:hypothetical protein
MIKQRENTILVVEVGSTAHGTGLEGAEDHDETAIVIETIGETLIESQRIKNHMVRTKPEGKRSEPGDTDRQVYSLRNYLDLAIAGNPSILLTLWAPVIKGSIVGYELRKLSTNFIGRHMIPKYRGYMQGQCLRILGLKSSGHGRRGGGQRAELIEQHGYDTKYAMHAARLGYQCIELLTQQHLQLPIAGAAGDFLRAVRKGEIPFDEWWNTVLDLDARLERLVKSESFRLTPNVQKIYRWSIDTHMDFWNNPHHGRFYLK